MPKSLSLSCTATSPTWSFDLPGHLPACPFCLPQDAIDSAVTAAVGGDISAIGAWKVDCFIPFNPVDKKTVAEVSWLAGWRAGGMGAVRQAASQPG